MENNGLNKRTLLILFFAAILVILLPIVIFTIRFNSHRISNDISDWSDFGTYFSGMLQPLIGILSLIVLGYITFLVSKLTSKENYRLNILQRRLDAYDKLSEYLSRINSFRRPYVIVIRKLRTATGDKIHLPLNEVQNEIAEILEIAKVFSDYKSFLHQFRIRYGHLFKQRFDNDSNNQLIQTAIELSEYYFDLYENLVNGHVVPENAENMRLFEQHATFLAQFILNIRGELTNEESAPESK